MTDRAAIIGRITAIIAETAPGPIADTSPVDVSPKAKTPVPPASLPPSVEQAKAMIERLRSLGFRPYLDDRGVLMIADETGRRRDVSWHLPVAKVFNDLTAGLDQDPGLLDSGEATS